MCEKKYANSKVNKDKEYLAINTSDFKSALDYKVESETGKRDLLRLWILGELIVVSDQKLLS